MYNYFGDYMDRKKFITLLIVSIFVLIASATLYIILGPAKIEGEYSNRSEEFKKYDSMFTLELVEEAGEKYYVIKGLSTTFSKGENNNYVVEFPDTIDDIKVTKILSTDDDFYSFRNIKKLIISRHIEYIGTTPDSGNITDNPFLMCSSLENIEVDSENKVFSSLEGVLYDKEQTTLVFCPTKSPTLSDGNYTLGENVTKINSCAFYSNVNLSEIVLNNKVTSIGTNAFYNCDSLTSIVFGSESNLKVIGSNAFSNCNILKNVVLPDSVEQIDSSVFSNCNLLESVFIPSSVKVFGNNIFGSSASVIISTNSANLEFLRCKNEQLGIKNKDIYTRIIGVN